MYLRMIKTAACGGGVYQADSLVDTTSRNISAKDAKAWIEDGAAIEVDHKGRPKKSIIERATAKNKAETATR